MAPLQRRVLIVEDEFLIARMLARAFQAAHFDVVGPFGRLSGALEAATTEAVDAGLLDINVNGEPVFPAADALRMRGVPILFVSGYQPATLPARYRDAPLLNKPVSPEFAVAALGRILALPKEGGHG